MLCAFLHLFILSTIYKNDTPCNYTYTVIMLYLYINFASVPNLYFILDGLKNIHKVPKSSIHDVLLTTFHKQEQRSLGFWVFFVVLQWVLQLSLKQMMGQVLENLVIYGTNV